jgi:hypothetical protein
MSKLGWSATCIRELFESHGLELQDWDKIRTDWLTFHNTGLRALPPAVARVA